MNYTTGCSPARCINSAVYVFCVKVYMVALEDNMLSQEVLKDAREGVCALY